MVLVKMMARKPITTNTKYVADNFGTYSVIKPSENPRGMMAATMTTS